MGEEKPLDEVVRRDTVGYAAKRGHERSKRKKIVRRTSTERRIGCAGTTQKKTTARVIPARKKASPARAIRARKVPSPARVIRARKTEGNITTDTIIFPYFILSCPSGLAPRFFSESGSDRRQNHDNDG